MMDKISIFNYEAFYLDYLEGRLNEEDTRELMAFFKAYPECRLEDEDLEAFNCEETQEVPSFKGKHDLKMVDETDVISTENIEHFIIAGHEGILDQTKEKELKAFVAEHGMEVHQQGFGLAYFEPDTSIRFAAKEDLKRKAAVVTWYWYAAAAAVIAFVFFMLIPNNKAVSFDAPAVYANDQEKAPSEKQNKIVPRQQEEKNALQEYRNVLPYLEQKKDKKGAPQVAKARNGNVEDLHVNRPHLLSNVAINEDLQPLTPSLQNASESHQELLANNTVEMYNPIEPITKAISNRTKTPVDFQKATANSERKGFHVKIGKFEVSRTSGKK